MKRIKFVKVIASSLVVISALALNPIAASAQWKQNDTGWWYTEGSSWANGWKILDGKWYYFNSDGYMAHDTIIDGCKLGSDGAWIQDQDTVLATVGDEKITKDDFNKVMNLYDEKLKKQYGNDYATNNNIKDQLLKMKKQQLNNMVIEKIYMKKAAELNLKQLDNKINSKVDETIKQYKAQYASEAQFKTVLLQNGTTEEKLKESIKKEIILNLLQEDILKDVTVTDHEVQADYDENKDTKYAIGAGATVAHILVTDIETAKSLKAKLDAGADFATLAKENSKDTGTKNKGGNLGFIPYNSTQLVTEFMNGFKNLKEDEVSEPVKSEYGYHLIKVTNLKSAEVIPFDEIKNKIKTTLLQQKQEAIYNSKMEQWKTDLKVKTYEDRL